MEIKLLVEPDYEKSFWCLKTLKELYLEAARKKHRIELWASVSRQLQAADNCRTPLLISGSSISWMYETLKATANQNFHPILVGMLPPINHSNVSAIAMDYRTTTISMIEYLQNAGKNRIALYGVNPDSFADVLKKETYLAYVDAHKMTGLVFTNNGSLGDCFNDFAPYVPQFDAAICANDVAAISLIKQLERVGVQVPRQMYVVSFGNTFLGQLYTPSLTTATLPFDEIGRQAISLCEYVQKNPTVTAMTLCITCVIKAGQASDYAESAAVPGRCVPSLPMLAAPSKVLFYSDSEVNEILKVESFLSNTDQIDRLILNGLLQEKKYAALSDELFVTENTLKYRLQKMLARFGLNDRGELLDIIKGYIKPGSLALDFDV